MAVVTRAQALTAVAAAACAVAESRTIVAAQTPIALKVGGGQSEAQAQVYYALEAGFFKKAGLDVDILMVRSGSITMQAIAGGQLQAGVGNAVSAGSGILRGIPFVFIAPGAMWNQTVHNSGIMVAQNSPIKTAKDLEGQTVAVGSLQGIGQLAFQTYVDQNGGDASAVKFIEIAPSATPDAIQSGRVAAGSIDDPEYSNAIESGKAKRLVYTYDWIAKTFYTSVWFTSQGWLQANKEAAKRFTQAVVAGGIWGETHRDQARDILEKYTKVHETRTTNVYGRDLNPALIQPLFDASYKYQIFPSPLRAADYCWDGK